MSEPVHIVCARCLSTNRVLRERLSDAPKCGRCKEALFSGHPFALTRVGFDRHLASDEVPLVVDFWAAWCAPCRMMAPAYERAAALLEPGVRLAKLDTEAEPEIAGRYAIRGIPTMILYRKGQEVARQSGALDVDGIVSWVRGHV